MTLVPLSLSCFLRASLDLRAASLFRRRRSKYVWKSNYTFATTVTPYLILLFSWHWNRFLFRRMLVLLRRSGWRGGARWGEWGCGGVGIGVRGEVLEEWESAGGVVLEKSCSGDTVAMKAGAIPYQTHCHMGSVMNCTFDWRPSTTRRRRGC